MKRFVLFLLGALSALALTIVFVKYPNSDPQEKLNKDKKKVG